MPDLIIAPGSTSVVREVKVIDRNTGFGKTGLTYATVTAAYVRAGGTTADITLIAGSPGDAYSSGKFAEVSAAKHPGLYQFHLPDALLASGADAVTLTLLATDVEQTVTIRLTADPAVPGDAMALADDAITATKFDESTAFPLKAADAGATEVARTGADGDTLKTLSDEIVAAAIDVYRARIYYREDAGNAVDEYTVHWEKNGVPVAAEDITTPTIEVIKRSDGTALIGATAMAWDDQDQALSYDGRDSERNTAAEVLKVIARATIGGSERADVDLVGRDQ